MADASRKAMRQKLGNLLFVQAAAENLPPELAGQADKITVNYPWGSLLKAVATPDVAVLSAIARLGKDGAAVTMLVNMSVFDDPTYCAKMGFPCPPVFIDRDRTRSMFGQAGLEVTKIVPDAVDIPHKTTWGQRLTKGTRRRVLLLEAVTRR
jgi:16S rRNA (adenine(1408)-N(1))-methyltransferase